MSIKKINIKELKVGMYMLDMDISWIKSPFLKHSRLIEKNNDIKLLIQAGVKEVSIDTDKTIIEKQVNDSENIKALKKETLTAINAENTVDNSEKSKEIVNGLTTNTKNNTNCNPKQEPTSLNQELKNAIFLKHKASEAFSNLKESLKQNKKLDIKEVGPIVDDSINSILRNNQALLTMMHMHRNEKDLFAHSFSVMSLLLSLAISLDYSDKQLTMLGTTALLHDLGWARLPLNLLSKNKKYTDSELKIIQQHISIVIRQLSSDPKGNAETIKLISEHHERGDGSGYPNGLKLNDLNPGSSLFILVDHYDELIHGLSDYTGVIPSLALKILYKEAKQGIYDKNEVEQLILLLSIYPLTSAVKLSTGEKGVVIEVNRNIPLKPKIKIFYDSKNVVVPNPYILDLNNDEQSRQISQLIDTSDSKEDLLQLLTS